ncbi:MAG: DNA mismatch endonuclease Vsr [Betaproteobacteria bacterium]|nr:DNA mismatch endonuclease Vsr [Betaproteobacteria bacterium]
MSDVVDAATRSRMMSRIRGKDTQPELLVRHQMHVRGFRAASSSLGLPGRPDLVYPKWNAAIFVHGCFWHQHGCSISRVPGSNQAFWNKKFEGNQDRDAIAAISMQLAGWRVAIVWECSLRGKAARQSLEKLMDDLAGWIKNQPESSLYETVKLERVCADLC